jgi:hypothetical protein
MRFRSKGGHQPGPLQTRALRHPADDRLRNVDCGHSARGCRNAAVGAPEASRRLGASDEGRTPHEGAKASSRGQLSSPAQPYSSSLPFTLRTHTPSFLDVHIQPHLFTHTHENVPEGLRQCSPIRQRPLRAVIAAEPTCAEGGVMVADHVASPSSAAGVADEA